MSQELLRRLETLEINQAFQEEALERLEQQVTLQQKQLDRLQRQLKNLLAQSKGPNNEANGQSGAFDPDNEVPPHY